MSQNESDDPVEGLETDLNEKNPINTVGFILQVKNGLLMYSNRVSTYFIMGLKKVQNKVCKVSMGFEPAIILG